MQDSFLYIQLTLILGFGITIYFRSLVPLLLSLLFSIGIYAFVPALELSKDSDANKTSTPTQNASEEQHNDLDSPAAKEKDL